MIAKKGGRAPLALPPESASDQVIKKTKTKKKFINFLLKVKFSKSEEFSKMQKSTQIIPCKVCKVRIYGMRRILNAFKIPFFPMENLFFQIHFH